MNKLVEQVIKDPFKSRDILIYIVVHSGLSIHDILSLAQTNKEFSKILKNEDIWRRIFIERFIIGRKVSRKEYDELTQDKSIEQNKEYIQFNKLIPLYSVFICFKAEVIARDRTKIYTFRKDNNDVITILPNYTEVPLYADLAYLTKNNTQYVAIIYNNTENFVMDTYDTMMYKFIPLKEYPHEIDYYFGTNRENVNRIREITIYIPKEDLARIVGYLMFYEYIMTASETPDIWLEKCISCRINTPTLLDTWTGLKFCTEECFNKFGIH